MQDNTGTRACPRCAHENDADTHFCGNCGLRIDGLCPNCGTQNEHSTHFCSNCGHDFAADATPQATSASGDLRGVPGPVGQPGAPQPGTAGTGGIECPRCHRTNELGAVFCYNCGLPFDAAAGFQPRNTYTGDIPAFATGRPGGFWIRFVAVIIDNIIVNAVSTVIVLLFSGGSIGDYYAGTGPWTAADTFILLVSFAYSPVLLALYSTTVGKRAFNLYVVQTDGSRLSFWRALARELSKFISGILLGAGYLMAAFRDDKRALHDLIAGTVVVQRR